MVEALVLPTHTLLMKTHAQWGLTLVELLVVIAIVGILAGLAAPGLRGFIAGRALLAASGALASDYRLARAEAIKRTAPVTICRSGDGATCETAAGSWHVGWIVFSDMDGDGAVDTSDGDTVIRVQSVLPSIVSASNLLGASSTRIRTTFRPTGLAVGSADNIVMTASASVANGTRLICISNHGRASVRDLGASAC